MKQNIKNLSIIQNIIDNIKEENTLKTFFSKNNIAEIDQIVNIQRYQQRDYRGGLILTVLEKGFDDKTKVLIDVRHGLTSINQVYESLYDIGVECDIRIIAYTNGANGHDKFNPGNDEYAILSLMAELQADNVPIALYEIDKETSEMKYIELYQGWERVDRSQSCEVPTREQFIAETFWSVYFDSFNTGFYEPWNTYTGFRNIDDWGHLIYIGCPGSGEIEIYWDQKGVRFVVKHLYPSEDALQKAMDSEMRWIHDKYETVSIGLDKEIDRSPSIIIKYSDRPFDWLYTANPNQIHAFAKSMHEDAWNLRWQIEESIDGPIEAQSA